MEELFPQADDPGSSTNSSIVILIHEIQALVQAYCVFFCFGRVDSHIYRAFHQAKYIWSQ